MNDLINRCIHAVILIILTATMVFLAIRLTPGDPVERILGPKATMEEKAQLRKELGLDQPILTQYKNFWKQLLSGDLGSSLYNRKKKVTALIKKRAQSTVVMAIGAIILAALLGPFLGVLGAIRQNQTTDKVLRVATLIVLAIPIFSLAPLLILVGAIQLQLLPVSEWGTWKHAVLPILTLGIPLGCVLSRVARNVFLEEKNAYWTTVLAAKGLTPIQVYLRIFKVCLPTLLNVIALQLSIVLAGTMVTETIFDIPGMGTLLLSSIQSRDYPVVQGVILYSGLIYVLAYIFVDLINGFLDPRMRDSTAG